MIGFIVATAINAFIYGLQYYIILRQHYDNGKQFWDIVGGFCLFEALIFMAWLWR